jgi:Uma2 family endonuclease
VLKLYPRPIELRTPLETEAYLNLPHYFWRRELWDGQPPGKELGWSHWLEHSDIGMKLFSLFDDIRKHYQGLHIGRVPIAMSETIAVAPDHYYYGKKRDECLIRNDYFFGVPDLIAELLSPASRAIDHGPRKELYRRAGVRHLWILDPELETVQVYELTGSDYDLRGTYCCGDAFRPVLFPSVSVQVNDLFDIQRQGYAQEQSDSAPEPIPEWLVPQEQPVGLEYMLLLGHPERRSEIWNNRAPCMLPFGSAQEARFRFEHFLAEACRWEQQAMPKPSILDPEVEQAEVGRFRLTRKGRIIHVDVAVDGRKFRQLLEVWADSEAWDWGE